MENCLKTQLKATVDLSNPQYLGKVLIKVTFPEGSSSRADLGLFTNIRQEQVTMLSLGTVSVMLSEGNAYHLYVTPVSDNTVVSFLLDKYKVSGLNLTSNDVAFTIDQLITCTNLENIFLGGVDRGATTKDLSELKKLRNIVAKNYDLAGSLSDIAKITSLRVLELQFSLNVSGDLSEIKDMPNLTRVTINQANVTDYNNAVAYMQNRGITVSYTPRS